MKILWLRSVCARHAAEPSFSADTVGRMSRPSVWRCNACGSEGKTSREHLIHVAIGRVILGDKRLTRDEVRTLLQSGDLRDFRRHRLGAGFPLEDHDVGPGWFNTEIRGLLCESCNSGWAKDLEEQAGANLYDFTEMYGRADAQVLRRWAMFFAIKLWWAYSRPEPLAGGALITFLGKLVDPAVQVGTSIRLARLTSSRRDWNFAATMGGWAGGGYTPFIAWIMRGVVWLVVVATEDGKGKLPIKTTELVDGLALTHVTTIRRRDLVPLFSADAWVPPTRGKGSRPPSP